MKQTEFNTYGMDSSINDVSVIERAERLIKEGKDPRNAYNQAIKEIKKL